MESSAKHKALPELLSLLLQLFAEEKLVKVITGIVQSAVRAEICQSTRVSRSHATPLQGLPAEVEACQPSQAQHALRGTGQVSEELLELPRERQVSSEFGSEARSWAEESFGLNSKESFGLAPVAAFSEDAAIAAATQQAAPNGTGLECVKEEQHGSEEDYPFSESSFQPIVSATHSVLKRHPRRFDIFQEDQFKDRKAKGRTSLEFGATLEVDDIINRLTDSVQADARGRRPSVVELMKVPRRKLAVFVESGWLDYTSAIFILMNAVTLGAQANHMMVNVTEKDPPSLRALEVCFCVVFTIELLLRIIVHRCTFFSVTAPGWLWNWFDAFVVFSQLIEEMLNIITLAFRSDGGEGDGFASKFGVIRMLRILRLVRIMRLVRVLHLIGELRTLIVSLFTCARSLGWTMVLVFLTIYMLSIYVMQSIAVAQVEDPTGAHFETIQEYFASLPDTLLTLYKCVTGGVNWHVVARPLNEHISPTLTVVLCLYVSFTLLALFNIVTGVFVENAVMSAKKDKDLYMLHHVCDLFGKGDTDADGVLSKDEFVQLIKEAEMQTLMKDIGLAPDEVLALFAIVDENGDGSITPEEFVNGCLRCRGDARAYEVALLSHELRSQGVMHQDVSSKMTRLLGKMDSAIKHVTDLERRLMHRIGQAKAAQPTSTMRGVMLQKPRG